MTATLRPAALDAVRRRIDAGKPKVGAFAHRTTEAGVLAAVVGVLTGLFVAVLDTVIVALEEEVASLPLWLAAVVPGGGLLVTAAILRWPGGRTSPGTADEYLIAFHDEGHALPLRGWAARTAGAIATLGAGGPMGLEGISLYSGSAIGDRVRRLSGRLLGPGERRILLVAGAAAGVAAIFKAPATGAVFALEVPYQDEFARHMLVPALVGSATGYLAFASLHGTTPLMPVEGAPPFTYTDLLAAVALGVLAGVGARLFARGLRWVKGLAGRFSVWRRAAVGGVVLAALVLASQAATGAPLALGPGYEAIEWALDPSRALWAVAALLVIRCVGTTTAIGAGGVGGLFVPLVVAGALLGRFVGGAIHHLETSLYAVIGVAAFLGAGYRVPLAGVMFVAEATGRPGFVVPGLLAAVAAELVMGRASVTAYQRPATSPGGDDDGTDDGIDDEPGGGEELADGVGVAHDDDGLGGGRPGVEELGDGVGVVHGEDLGGGRPRVDERGAGAPHAPGSDVDGRGVLAGGGADDRSEAPTTVAEAAPAPTSPAGDGPEPTPRGQVRPPDR